VLAKWKSESGFRYRTQYGYSIIRTLIGPMFRNDPGVNSINPEQENTVLYDGFLFIGP
jgi:hypothetical protein